MSQLIVTILVVLGLPVRSAALLAYVKTIILKMTGNTNFTTPSPTLAAVTAAATAYESAQLAVKTTKDTTGDRAAKKAALVALLKHLRDYVQGICEQNVDNAAAIAASAGMRLKNMPVRVKALFAVTQGLNSGSVICNVKSAGQRATYYWAYSLDQKTWTSAPDSMTSKVTITGLTVGQVYYFRYHTLTPKGSSDLSQVVSFLVK